MVFFLNTSIIWISTFIVINHYIATRFIFYWIYVCYIIFISILSLSYLDITKRIFVLWETYIIYETNIGDMIIENNDSSNIIGMPFFLIVMLILCSISSLILLSHVYFKNIFNIWCFSFCDYLYGISLQNNLLSSNFFSYSTMNLYF